MESVIKGCEYVHVTAKKKRIKYNMFYLVLPFQLLLTVSSFVRHDDSRVVDPVRAAMGHLRNRGLSKKRK